MTERMRFVARLKDGESMAELCREFGISRKTGYKIVERYEKAGLDGLRDQSRAPRSHPNQTALAIRQAVIQTRLEHPTWGAPKIKAYLEKKLTSSVIPARSTVHTILEREKLIKLKRRARNNFKAKGSALSAPQKPNELWCADFKGQFKLANKSLCYPLTVTDQVSRFLLMCEAQEGINEDECIRIFHCAFSEYGLPDAIRTDNGVPFASSSYFGLSKLSVFWLRLGIRIERIIPGHPEENGQHERMHRTLKAEATIPASANIFSQQEQFDSFRQLFNFERPHQGIGMKRPADIYQPSQRSYDPIIEPLEYPDHERVLRVTNCGSINIEKGFKIYIGTPFAGYNLGIKEVDEQIWSVSFMNYELGFFDLESGKMARTSNPFLMGRDS